MPRKDKNITPSVKEKLQQLGYNVADWDDSKTKLTEDIREVLSTASKSQKGNEGFPDLTYMDEKNKYDFIFIATEDNNIRKKFIIETDYI